jgi:hypothetical protein
MTVTNLREYDLISIIITPQRPYPEEPRKRRLEGRTLPFKFGSVAKA